MAEPEHPKVASPFAQEGKSRADYLQGTGKLRGFPIEEREKQVDESRERTTGDVGRSYEQKNERNAKRSYLRETLIAAISVSESKDNSDPGRWACGPWTITRSLVAPGTPADPLTLTLVSSEVEVLNDTTALKTNIEIDSSVSLTTVYRHPLFRLKMTETTSIAVTGSTQLPSDIAGTEVRIEPIDCRREMVTTTTMEGWAGLTLETTENFDASFPAYIRGSDWSPQDGWLKQRRRSIFNLNYNIRPSRSRTVPARVVHSLHDVRPANAPFGHDPGEWWTIFPVNINYNGTLFSIGIQGVLSDAKTLQANTNSEDVYYGFGVESYATPESTPNASDYHEMIGEERIFNETIQKIEPNLWHRKQYFVTLE